MALTFIREFLKSPTRIGAIAPSSRALSRQIVASAKVPDALVIVECGPGTGVFTREILDRKHPDAVFCAIESNKKMAEKLRKRFPDTHLFEDSVENLVEILHTLGETEVDSIVCGLPWAAFDADLQDRLMNAILSVLRDGGTFATFAYLQGLVLKSGKRFRRKLDASFSSVGTSPVVWRNLPPAFVYRCEK